jgi:hypothetical protein
MNKANGIQVTVIGATLVLDGESIALNGSATLDECKDLARFYRKAGRQVQLKRAPVATYVKPATARDARVRGTWERKANDENDDGSWRDANPWTWNIVGQSTEDLTK